MPSKQYVAITGSERQPIPGATKSGAWDPKESLQVTVVLRPRPLGKKVKPLEELIASGERLTRAQYEARYGADPKDVQRIRVFARTHGLKVCGVNRAARTVKLTRASMHLRRFLTPRPRWDDSMIFLLARTARARPSASSNWAEASANPT